MTPLENVQKLARERIDYIAEVARRRFTTQGGILTGVYQLKIEEAADFIAAGYPADQIDNYPMIRAEMIATGKTSTEVADGIVTARSMWVAKMSVIEQIRLAINKNIRDAIDEDDVRDICTAGEIELLTFGNGGVPPATTPEYPW